MKVHLEDPALRHERAFIEAVKRSGSLHRPWVSPPRTPERYRRYLKRTQQPTFVGHLVCLPDGELAGVINVSEIVLGVFRSAYLGYYAFAPHQRQGHMAAGIGLVLDAAFRKYGLHRLEANIQPTNLGSIALVKSLGFRLEGFSPKYVKIGGRYRDHERWAILAEDWRARKRRGARRAR